MISEEDPDQHRIVLSSKGFRFVRCFLGLIILLAVILVISALVMSWKFGMNVTVEGKGVIEPVDRHWVKAPVSGIVERLLPRQGQLVAETDTVVVLDTTEQLAELQTLRNDLEINRSRGLELKLEIDQETRVGKANLRRAHADLARARMELVHVLAEQRLSSNRCSNVCQKAPGRAHPGPEKPSTAR